MDNSQEHLKNLSEIRSLMERSSSFLSLSGLSGISAGIIGIAAAIILQIKIGPFINPDAYFTGVLTVVKRSELIYESSVLFAVVLIAVFGFAILFTTRKAKKNGLALWDASAKRLVVNLFIPLIAGGLFCILLAVRYYDYAILPSMLIFFGLALINASKFTLKELMWLGVTEIIIGLAALAFPAASLILWGLGFGVMNIIYGALMYYRYER